MSRVKTVIAAAVPQAWKSWRSQQTGLPDSNFQIVTPNKGNEPAVRPGRPLHIDTGARVHSSGSPSGSHPYGYAAYTNNANSGRSGSAGPSSLRSSPERHRHDSHLGRVPEESGILEGDDELDEVDEEEEEEEDLELEEQGLYRGQLTLSDVFNHIYSILYQDRTPKYCHSTASFHYSPCFSSYSSLSFLH
jgi:hypothetical protein